MLLLLLLLLLFNEMDSNFVGTVFIAASYN